MTSYRYRISVDGQDGPILTANPTAVWRETACVADERGLRAVLYRQLVTDESIFPLLNEGGVKPDGWIVLKNGMVLSPWEEFAVVDGRKA